LSSNVVRIDLFETSHAAECAWLQSGRKGGTVFPPISLEQALPYADKLVSKTQIGPQPEIMVLADVFGSTGPTGQVRASALKQFGLLKADRKAYEATELAKAIVSAPREETGPLLRSAFLNSKLFSDIFDIFHGDTVSRTRIKQRSLALMVLPELADECVSVFLKSAETAGLCTVNGDKIIFSRLGMLYPLQRTSDRMNDERREPLVWRK
jgi:hypothetical protein